MKCEECKYLDKTERICYYMGENRCVDNEEQSEDAISRQAVISTIYDNKSDFKNDFAQGFFADRIRDLPSVNPQPKTGHWEWEQYYYSERGNWHCSECKSVVAECVDKNEKGGIPLYKYCPQCGIKMVEPQESEGRNE